MVLNGHPSCSTGVPVGGRLRPDSPRCQIACYSFKVVPIVNGNRLRMPVHIYNAQTGLAFDAAITAAGSTYHAAHNLPRRR